MLIYNKCILLTFIDCYVIKKIHLQSNKFNLIEKLWDNF